MKNIKLSEGIKYWSQVLLLPVYWFSFLVPRNKRIWVFGSTFGRRFADNPKYFYLYLNKHPEENIRAIWITHDETISEFLNKKGYEAYHINSPKGIWYALRGGVYLFDNYSKDISFWLSGGAVKFNLWHGSGNKRTNFDNLFDKVRHPKNLWERFKTFPRRLSDEKPHHYTLATSQAMAEITQSAFHTSREHVIIDGYPRNDAVLDSSYPNFFSKEEKENREYILKWKQEGKKIDFYMPTFRDSEGDFFKVVNLETLNRFFMDNNIIFITKLHPKSKIKAEFSKIDYSNIRNIDAKIDPYTFLEFVDILTTDYSSIYTDFMLFDKPVVAFPYDYEKYSGGTREEYIPSGEYMPELTAINQEELMEFTLRVLANDSNRELRKISRDRMFLYQDANATGRLVEKVKKIIGLS